MNNDEQNPQPNNQPPFSGTPPELASSAPLDGVSFNQPITPAEGQTAPTAETQINPALVQSPTAPTENPAAPAVEMPAGAASTEVAQGPVQNPAENPVIPEQSTPQFSAPSYAAPKPAKDPKNQKMFIALVIVVAAVLICGIVALVAITAANNNKKSSTILPQTSQEEFTESYDLSDLAEDLHINKSGSYELYGVLDGHSVYVEDNAEVKLYLSKAEIYAAETAAIINLTSNPLTIELEDGTMNMLSDGGASDYDGCIYSEGDLIINGDGALVVDGMQTEGEGIATENSNITINGGMISITSVDDGINAGGEQGGTITINGGEIHISAGGDGIDSNKDLVINGGTINIAGPSISNDAAIDTDAGYVINGGTVMATGFGMLEAPQDNSSQNSLAISLENSYQADSKVELIDADGISVISFTAQETFRTLVLSSPDIRYGTYSLTIDGITVIENLAVINTVTTYGNLDAPQAEPGNNPDMPPADEGNNPNDDGDDTYGRIPINQLPGDEN